MYSNILRYLISNNPSFLDTDIKKITTDKLLVDLIVLDLQPLSIVEDTGFRALINYLDPKYNIPSRKTVKKLIENAYNEKKCRIQEELAEASDVSVTTDTWSSMNKDHFLSTTCHFTTKNFELKTYVLQTDQLKGSHTSDVLSDALRYTFSEWNVEGKVRAVVTDNAANMLAAVRILGNSISSVSCFAHTLNLVIKKAISSVDDLVTVRKKCRSILLRSNFFQTELFSQG